jgi:hypothetical protein
MKIALSEVYRLNPAIVIEDFGERSLALHCTELRLVELNATARDWVRKLDGQTTIYQVAQSIAEDYCQPLETVLEDVQVIVSQMIELGVVEHVALPRGHDPNTGCQATIDRA